MSKKIDEILVVDDDPDLLILTSTILKAKYSVRTALNGEEALATIESGYEPKLIVLDVMMPIMDGFATCKNLRANKKTKHTPIIFLTSKDELSNEVKGLSLGAVDYLAKPINPTKLLARTKSHITHYNLLLTEQKSKTRKKLAAILIVFWIIGMFGLAKYTALLDSYKQMFEQMVKSTQESNQIKSKLQQEIQLSNQTLEDKNTELKKTSTQLKTALTEKEERAIQFAREEEIFKRKIQLAEEKIDELENTLKNNEKNLSKEERDDTKTITHKKKVGCVEGTCENGHGTFVFADGLKHIGYWKDGQAHGRGTRHNSDKRIITGIWKNGTLAKTEKTTLVIDQSLSIPSNQKNTQTQRNKKSSRCLLGDCKNGRGKFVYNSGTYFGEFKNGKRHGIGIYYYTSKDKYKGEWYQGDKNGVGTFFYADGRKYVGNWKNGKKHGNGTLIGTNKRIQHGLWVNGSLVISK